MQGIRAVASRVATLISVAAGGLTLHEIVIRTWKACDKNEVMTRASAIAFYAMLAMVPFLGLILTLSVKLLPDLSGRFRYSPGIGNLTVEQLESVLREMFPREISALIEEQIGIMQSRPPTGFLSVGLVVTLWLASALFVALNDSLNRIYGVLETRPFWKLRLLAIAMTLVQAVLLVGTLLAILVWPHVVELLGLSPVAAVLAYFGHWLVVTGMILLSFALTFFFGADAGQSWRWITPGSLVGTFCFLGETFVFRIYVERFAHYDKTYGTLGGVMALLFWFWVSSTTLLAAAALNKVIGDAYRSARHERRGSGTAEPDRRVPSTELPSLS